MLPTPGRHFSAIEHDKSAVATLLMTWIAGCLNYRLYCALNKCKDGLHWAPQTQSQKNPMSLLTEIPQKHVSTRIKQNIALFQNSYVVKTKQNIFLPAAGVDVRAEDSDRPLAEVEVIDKANGVAEPAGLLKPKLKPVVAADVVAGVPKRNPQNNYHLWIFCLRMSI